MNARSTGKDDIVDQPIHDSLDALARLAIGEQNRAPSPHYIRFLNHEFVVGTDIGRQVRLVDHQNVRLHDAQSTLAWDVVAACGVDNEKPLVDQLARECRREIVPAGLDEHDV